jgi:hypothetical protein
VERIVRIKSSRTCTLFNHPSKQTFNLDCSGLNTPACTQVVWPRRSCTIPIQIAPIYLSAARSICCPNTHGDYTLWSKSYYTPTTHLVVVVIIIGSMRISFYSSLPTSRLVDKKQSTYTHKMHARVLFTEFVHSIPLAPLHNYNCDALCLL